MWAKLPLVDRLSPNGNVVKEFLGEGGNGQWKPHPLQPLPKLWHPQPRTTRDSSAPRTDSQGDTRSTKGKFIFRSFANASRAQAFEQLVRAFQQMLPGSGVGHPCGLVPQAG